MAGIEAASKKEQDKNFFMSTSPVKISNGLSSATAVGGRLRRIVRLELTFLKSSTQGYDGKGNMIIKCEDDIEKAYNYFMNQEIFVEELVDFVKEVSIIVVKNNSETIFYPISENIHEDSILIKSIVPAAISDDIIRKIHLTSEKIMDKLDDLGVYCIEYFIDRGNDAVA